jgi:AcrR family transcriptional regulator
MALRPRKPSRSKKTRTRRDAESARQAILDAAERRLVTSGPGGLRLQDIARDVGVSHPTVLHHLGSREALLKAVIRRAVESINLRLLDAARTSTGSEADIGSMVDGVFEALSTTGYGRLILWLALEGQTPVGGENVSLADVVDALQSVRSQAHPDRDPAAAREDTAHAVVLVALALLGSTVLGPGLMERAGLPKDAAAQARFRRWLSQLLARHLHTAPG